MIYMTKTKAAAIRSIRCKFKNPRLVEVAIVNHMNGATTVIQIELNDEDIVQEIKPIVEEIEDTPEVSVPKVEVEEEKEDD